MLSFIFFALLWALLLGGRARADIYIYKDPKGVLNFSNVPTHGGFRPFIRERNGTSRGSLASGRYEEMIREAAERYGVDPHLVRAVIKAESDFNSYARSRKGAQGLMQLMPETARLHDVQDVYDPDDNIDGGVRHLRMLLDRYGGDLRLALAGYNAGVKAVEKYGGIPPYPETRDYIRRVLNYHQRYSGNGTVSTREQRKRRDK